MKKEPRRQFSTSFKKEKVALLEKGKISVRELCLIYNVSDTAVYQWKKKFGSLPRTERYVVEHLSEEAKNIELRKQIMELERTVGKKQLELDYLTSVIEIASAELGEDFLKRYRPKP